jgi:hypothetical protein
MHQVHFLLFKKKWISRLCKRSSNNGCSRQEVMAIRACQSEKEKQRGGAQCPLPLHLFLFEFKKKNYAAKSVCSLSIKSTSPAAFN